MGIFDCLPNLEKCCYCIPLRIGCLIYGFLSLISSIQVYTVYSELKDTPDAALWIGLNAVTSLIVVIFGIMLLVGVYVGNGTFLSVSMWLVVVGVIYHVAITTACALSNPEKKTLMYNAIATSVVGLACGIYVMIIINSYKHEEGLD